MNELWAVAAYGFEYRGALNLDNNDSKRRKVRQFTGSEFARMSASMQLMLITIRRAQLSSRRAIDSAAEQKRRLKDFDVP